MQKDALNNVHITDEQVLMTPEQLKAAFPLSLQQEAHLKLLLRLGTVPRLIGLLLFPLVDFLMGESF